MIEVDGWQWARWGWPGLAMVAALATLIVVVFWRERRVARSAWPSLAARLLVVAWLGPAVLGLEAWHEVREPRPARYLLLADATGSVDVVPETARELARTTETLAGRLNATAKVSLRSYAGRGVPTVWAAAPPQTVLPGGPTRMLDDLAMLPPDDVGEDVLGVLIVDGAEQSMDVAAAVTLPVAAVLLPPSPRRPSPVWLADVRSDAYALVRSPLRVSVRIGRVPDGPDRFVVRIHDGDRILGEQGGGFERGARVTDVTLDVLPMREGELVLRAELVQHGEPIVAAAHETRLPVRVLRDRLRLLHVVGRPDWESRLVREILREDPVVDLVSFQILRTIDDNPGTRSDRELSLIPFPTEKLFSEELPKFDIVVFQNFDYAPYFPAPIARSLLENVARFVERDGGGFVMTAGEQAFGFGRYDRTPLAGVLPVRFSSPGAWWPVAGPLRRDPKWGGWFGARPPAADGLVDRVVVASPTDDARVVWWAGEQPAVVVGRKGEGRTAAVLTDRLWRAATFGEPTDRAAIADLWTRVLRWLAGDPQFEDLHVRWSATRVVPGARVTGRVVPPWDGSAELVDEAGAVTPVTVAAGQFEATLPRRAAAWRLRIDGREAPEPLIAELPLEERTGPPLDRELWARWASERGARLATFDEADDADFLDALSARASSVTARRVEPVHAMPWWWALGVLLIVGEIALRRLLGDP